MTLIEQIKNWYLDFANKNFKIDNVNIDDIDVDREDLRISFVELEYNYKISLDIEHLSCFSFIIDNNEKEMSTFENKEMKELSKLKYSELIKVIDRDYIEHIILSLKANIVQNNLVWSPIDVNESIYIKYKNKTVYYNDIDDYFDALEQLIEIVNY